MEKYNDMNKVIYMSKIKFNCENQISKRQKEKEKVKFDRQYNKAKLSKWDDFRQRRTQAIENYLSIKRVKMANE